MAETRSLCLPSTALSRACRRANSWKSTPDVAHAATKSKDASLNARREDERLARRRCFRHPPPSHGEPTSVRRPAAQPSTAQHSPAQPSPAQPAAQPHSRPAEAAEHHQQASTDSTDSTDSSAPIVGDRVAQHEKPGERVSDNVVSARNVPDKERVGLEENAPALNFGDVGRAHPQQVVVVGFEHKSLADEVQRLQRLEEDSKSAFLVWDQADRLCRRPLNSHAAETLRPAVVPRGLAVRARRVRLAVVRVTLAAVARRGARALVAAAPVVARRRAIRRTAVSGTAAASRMLLWAGRGGAGESRSPRSSTGLGRGESLGANPFFI